MVIWGETEYKFIHAGKDKVLKLRLDICDYLYLETACKEKKELFTKCRFTNTGGK